MAVPFELNVIPLVGVPPSIVSATVPDGTVDPVEEVTVTVKLSAELMVGAVFDAETVVVVPISAGPVLEGHALARL